MMMRVTLMILAFSGSCMGQELIEGKSFEHFAGVSIQLPESLEQILNRNAIVQAYGLPQLLRMYPTR